MKIERCPQGHFYDAHRHESCPLCPPEPASLAPPAPMLPVVGWLVCTGVPCQGLDFRLRPGYNYLGSGPQSDIAIPWDDQISPERAAVLGYDDQWNLFSFGPCGGRLPVRVNGKMILDAVVLNPGDRLTVGSTELLFVPLCGSEFRWKKDK